MRDTLPCEYYSYCAARFPFGGKIETLIEREEMIFMNSAARGIIFMPPRARAQTKKAREAGRHATTHFYYAST